MVDYASMQTRAADKIAEYGQSITLTRAAVTGTASGTRIPTYGTPITITGYGVEIEYTASEIDGTIVQKHDIKLIVNALTTAPAVDDTCTYGGTSYRVMNVKKLSPGGTVLLYELQLRK